MISFDNKAWDQYIYWQKIDKKMAKKINTLLRECARTPFDGLGKPEPLKNELSGFWSRRIDREHRLVYKVMPDQIIVASCRYHYDL